MEDLSWLDLDNVIVTETCKCADIWKKFVKGDDDKTLYLICHYCKQQWIFNFNNPK